jgi:2-polyprenyl-3-methyl-5-hydroxy-6-metoxy-1,4-benzoquinol methylase
MPNAACPMCANTTGNRPVELHELMYGSGEAFEYRECATCGTLSIAEPPADMSRYYKDDYYSFRKVERRFRHSPLRTFIRKKRAGYKVHGRDVIGRLLEPPPEHDWFAREYTWDWFRHTGTGPDARVLDVGCGAGTLLYSMRDQGFDRLTGVDPFLESSSEEPGIRLVKGTLDDLQGRFDLVMSHHSLEHMADPRRALTKMRDLVDVGGWIILRVPVIGESWARYRERWVELDAPRHLFIPSNEGLRRLVAGVGGLELRRTAFDTMLFEVAGSELYMRNIPMRLAPDWKPVEYGDHFSDEELARFKADVARMNAEGTAGRTVLYLQKVR